MDRKGYTQILDAVKEVDDSATIIPIPGEGDDISCLTIETDVDVEPSLVMNALHNAGLTARTNPSPDGPSLDMEPCSVPGRLTFDDGNAY